MSAEAPAGVVYLDSSAIVKLVIREPETALDDALLDDAAAIDASKLRSHDAIHIASAQQLQAALDALVMYDESMLTAARALGLPVSRPT